MRHVQSFALNFLPVSWLRHRLQARTCKPDLSTQKKLIIDVSSIAQSDAKTGIQRVVRNLYQQLLLAPPVGYVVCPVVATRKQFYQYVSQDFLRQASPALRDSSTPIYIEPGDIFLGLDLSAHLIPHHLPAMWAWKKQGLRMSFVVYDLLPVLQPQWFNPRAGKNFHRWLRALALLADNAIAISGTVKADFDAWMRDHCELNEADLPCQFIQLGAELNTEDSLPANAPSHLPQQFAGKKFVLMVGTIEPRKGHEDVLDAFAALWATGELTELVIVGKPGWKVEALVQRLQAQSEAGKRLHWLDNANDEILRTLYRDCQGVIVASKGEGFGLPLIEAAYFNRPVLARDIPVFREIAGNNVSFFLDEDSNLLISLTRWIKSISLQKNTESYVNMVNTWPESSTQLLSILHTLQVFDSTVQIKVSSRSAHGACNSAK